MAFSYSARLRREIIARRASAPHGASQQFGQPNDSTTFNGATACTHVVLQWIIWRIRGQWPTIDQISKAAGYPPPSSNPKRRGLTTTEVKRVISHYGLPYRIVRGAKAADVWHASKRGLVGFGHIYGWWPEWKGYRYGAITADGRPNGYATPTGKAGRTQLSGFNNGRHFGLLMGYAVDPKGPDLGYAWEPNHGSSARPERPPYDRMTYRQWKAAYESFQKVGGVLTYALVPTRET